MILSSAAKTLVCIDMQTRFYASDEVLGPCLEEVDTATGSGNPVILVTFHGPQDLHPQLLPYLRYEKVYLVDKEDVSGGLEVDQIVRNFDLPTSLRVCGIETNCCVKETILELLDFQGYHSIEVAAHACANSGRSPWDRRRNHLKALDELAKLGVMIQNDH